MNFLNGFHGAVASLVLFSLLCVDETGVPIPFAPNEVLLLVGGVLIRTGAIAAWLFFPVAFAAMTAGMLVGYGWSRAVGQAGLTRLMRLVRAEQAHRDLLARLEAHGAPGIGVARLLPGIRPWATLSCGALGLPVQTFLVGAVPALLIWLAGWTALGVLVGLPAEHLLGAFQKLLLQGSLLLVLGAVSYLGLHQLQRRGLVTGQRRVVWLPLTLLIAGGAVASMAAGVLAVGRGIVGDDAATWVDGLVVAAVLAVVGGVAVLRDRLRRAVPPPLGS